MVDAVATIALETLRDLLIEKAKFLLSVSGQVKEVERQLTLMHCFLKDADKRKDRYDSDTVRHWVAELQDLSVKAENVLERYAIEVTSKREGKNLKKILRRFTCILSECLSVYHTGSDIEVIMSRMADLTKQSEFLSKGESSSRSTGDTDWSRKTFGLDVEKHFVGMKDEIELLESLLESDDKSHRVISICGMGGLGKTTVATKIYNGEIAQRCFDARAWICISQQFQPRSIFQGLLKQLVPHAGEELDENELVRKLYNVQKEKKCLLVLDDVWEVNHWNNLSHIFPVLESSSKVLLTTRNQNIASTEYVHMLGCLTEDEGWELLQKIALPTHHQQGVTPTELKLFEKTGRKIVRKCGYLPLAVSVVGGILQQERTLIEWENVCMNIDSYLQRGKGCFPEDHEINTEKLYLIWMAEGMVSSEDKGRGETMINVAERYLSELANRCMVQVKMDQESIYYRFKSCRLHDLVRELCLSKAKEEKFMKVVDMQTGGDDESSTCTSRLAVNRDEVKDDNIRKNQNLRSLLLLEKEEGYRYRDNFEGISLGMLRLLKILVLESQHFKNKKLPQGIEKLILLKYLSIRDSEVDELPKSVCKLPCLQSLDLQVSCEIQIPNSIHELRNLKHLFLHSDGRSIIGGGKLKLEGLDELETLMGFNSKTDETTHLLKLPKLQVLDADVSDHQSLCMIADHILNHEDQFREVRLEIKNECSINSVEGSNLVRKMIMCRSLSGLKIMCPVSILPTYEPQSYLNVVSLLLSESNIKKDPMGILEKLPVLRNLWLWNDAYVGKRMVCRATGFPQLRLLSLDSLYNLEGWRVEEGAMPNLVSLSIFECNNLEMIPDGLKYITTLHELLIGDMSEKFMDRIRVVNGQEGEDYHKIKHIPTIFLPDD
ncbi:putative disease resistance protein [Sesamum alatum]|uniref:Disease resistance protein n=1 Tax=Sesamum alatum TaxID=300844 RepID=A0AAE2CJT7_9LAMI|nr:putative disease resistance protein [Sesamum alatum]